MNEAASYLWALGWFIAIVALFAGAMSLPIATIRSRLAFESLLLVLTFGAGALAYRALVTHDVRFDTTESHRFTPPAAAVAIIRDLMAPLKISYFYQAEHPAALTLIDQLRVLDRSSEFLEVDLIDPDRELARARAAGMRFQNAAVIKSGEREILIRSAHITDIAVGVQRATGQVSSIICFLTGHGQPDLYDDEFHTHLESASDHSHGAVDSALIKGAGHGIGHWRRALLGMGYEVEELLLSGRDRVPSRCNAVVDAAPRTRKSDAEVGALLAYLEHGGAALFLYELDARDSPLVDQYLWRLGVEVTEGMVLDAKFHQAEDSSLIAVPRPAKHEATRDVALTYLAGARALRISKPVRGPAFAPYPLLVSSDASEVVTPHSDHRHSAQAEGAQTLAVAIETASKARLIVVGDADFVTNSFFPYASNHELARAFVRWLLKDEQLHNIERHIAAPEQILLTSQQVKLMYVSLVFAVPALALMAGGAANWRRWRGR
ncbi:MAG: Gldg family protein [Pseudomonadota bacterium]